MTKDSYWFSHDSNARNDVKIVRLRRQLGIEGYAIYFMLIEVLREQLNYMLPLEVIPDLAFEFHTSEEKMRAVVLNYDLFKIDEDHFFSARLIRTMESYKEQKIKYIEAGRKGGQASVKRRLSNASSDAQAIRVYKNRVNKNKGDNKEEIKREEKRSEHTFPESEIFNIEVFKQKLIGTQYEAANAEYYHEVIKNWAESAGAKKISWAAAAKSWMARDIKDGKFITKDYKPPVNGKSTGTARQGSSEKPTREQLNEDFTNFYKGK